MSALSAAIQADNPTHFWRLADLGGVSAVDIGSTPVFLFTESGSPSLGYSGPDSDGGSMYVAAGARLAAVASSTDNPPFTAECWIWLTKVNVNGWAFSPPYPSLGVSGANKAMGSTSGSAIAGSVDVSLTAWHQLAFVGLTGSRTLYLDGSVAVFDTATPANASGTFRVGSDGTSHFQGFISTVAWWNSALSSARILAHYNAADRRTTPPIYRVNGAPATTPGVITPTSDLATAILAAVRHTFPTT